MIIVMMMMLTKKCCCSLFEYDNGVDEVGDDANKKKMLFITHFMILTEQ